MGLICTRSYVCIDMFVNRLYNHFQVMSDSESDEVNENEENEEAPASPPPPQVTTLFFHH